MPSPFTASPPAHALLPLGSPAPAVFGARAGEDEWAKYVLKYTTKREPGGRLNLDDELTADAMGLQGFSPEERRMAAAAVHTQPVG